MVRQIKFREKNQKLNGPVIFVFALDNLAQLKNDVFGQMIAQLAFFFPKIFALTKYWHIHKQGFPAHHRHPICISNIETCLSNL